MIRTAYFRLQISLPVTQRKILGREYQGLREMGMVPPTKRTKTDAAGLISDPCEKSQRSVDFTRGDAVLKTAAQVGLWSVVCKASREFWCLPFPCFLCRSRRLNRPAGLTSGVPRGWDVRRDCSAPQLSACRKDHGQSPFWNWAPKLPGCPTLPLHVQLECPSSSIAFPITHFFSPLNYPTKPGVTSIVVPDRSRSQIWQPFQDYATTSYHPEPPSLNASAASLQ
jgi:hypothetical protein